MSNEVIHTEKYKGCTIKLITMEDAESPRSDDNLGTMVCWNRRHNLGDEQPRCTPYEYMRKRASAEIEAWRLKQIDLISQRVLEEDERDAAELEVDTQAEENDVFATDMFYGDRVVLPLYIYDHSGVTMKTSAFSCPWDSGKVGFIYCELDKAKGWFGVKDPGTTWDSVVPTADSKRTLREAATKQLVDEVANYDDWMNGRVVGFEATDQDGNMVDSCWGFYPENETFKYPDAIAHAKGVIDYYVKQNATINANQI